MRKSPWIAARLHGRPRHRPRVLLLWLNALWLLAGLLPARHAAAAGPLDRLDCVPGYTATIYAHSLRSPDGLAFAPDGTLYVVEEVARRVSRIEDGGRTSVLRGLKSPEGIAFDDAGNLYVVEDARGGRLIRMSPDGRTTTLAENLDAPEGVAVVTMPGEDGPTVYVTESNLQFERRPTALETRITAISAGGERRTVVSHTPRLHGLEVAFWSYAGLAAGPDGLLYVTNELSGRRLVREVVLLPRLPAYEARVSTGDSIFAVDPVRGTRTRVAEDLLVPEGLSFSAGGDFPLYVAEENVGNKGRLSRIERDGRRTTVCERFLGLEDVTVDAHGDLYVSEDGSGLVIRITVDESVEAGDGGPLTGPKVDLLPNSDRFWRSVARMVEWVQRIARRLR